MTQQQLKDTVQQVLIQWDAQRSAIEKAYAVNDEQKTSLIQPAIEKLEWLIRQSGKVENKHTGTMHYTLEPNNYDERMDFIKLHVSSHYSVIQLAMLYEEMKKKAARLRVQQ